MGETFLWWLAIEALGLAALPLAALLMRALPDRGYTASKPLGLLVVGWLAYTLSMLNLLPFGQALLIGCLLLLAAFSVWLLLRDGRAMLYDFQARFRNAHFLRHVLAAELLFAIAFAVWAMLRAYNPDIIDQEKFMDFGILNSILKSGTLPPHDMWFAGQPLNYYYFGYILMAAMTALSGVASEVSFNLANAFLFAMTALIGYGAVYNLIQGTITRRAVQPLPTPPPAADEPPTRGQPSEPVIEPAVEVIRPRSAVKTVRQTRRPVSFALAGAGVGAGGGTYAAVIDKEPVTSPIPTRRQGSATRSAAPLPIPGVAEVGEGSGDPVPVPFYLSPILYGVLAALMLVVMGNLTTSFAKKDTNLDKNGNGWSFCMFCDKQGYDYWWAPSRVIMDYRTTTNPDGSVQKSKVGYETINEFPAFSFVLGDMHPHVMALPLVLLAILAAYAAARRKVTKSAMWRDGIPRSLAAWTALLLTALIAGSLYTTNTWDYPTYLLVILLGMALPFIAAGRREGNWRRARPLIVQSALLVALSLLLFLPFHLTFKSFAGGQATPLPENIANIPLLGGLLGKLSGIFLLNTADKTITGFLVIFGIFLVAILGWVAMEFVSFMRRRSLPAAGRDNTLIGFGAFTAVTLILAVLLKFPLLGFLLPLIVVPAYLIWQEPRRTERNVALGIFMVAAAIGLSVEVVYLHDNFGNRMNTLFKFYYQIWVLWALASAYGFWAVLRAAFGPGPAAMTMPAPLPASRASTRSLPSQPVASPNPTTPGVKVLTGVWAAAFLLLVLSALPYGWYGSKARNVGGQTAARGLDGSAFLQSSIPDDYAAINWLKANTTGSDVLLECCHNEYDWPGRMSAFTGVPTLMAWDISHESLWRAGEADLQAQVGTRRAVVNAIYQGTDPASPGTAMSPAKLISTLNQYNVSYVVVGAVERGTVPGRTATLDKSEQITPYAESVMKAALKPVFTQGGTTVYGVRGAVVDPNAVVPTPLPVTGTPGAIVAAPDLNVPPLGLFAHSSAGINRGLFNLPRGIARDAAGDFYVTDTENKRVQKFDPTGKWLLMFGSKGSGDGQFAAISEDSTGTGPGGIAVDAQGNVYVADTWNHRIEKFDPNGKFLMKWGSFLSLADPGAPNETGKTARFYGPRGVAIGPDGNVYVTDTGNKRVLVFDPSGKPVRQIESGLTAQKLTDKYPFAAPGELNEPVGIAVDKAGNVYVADTNNNRIQKFDTAGKSVAQWAVPSGAWNPGPYLEPFLALDPAGNLYASAPTAKAILEFSPTGQLLSTTKTYGSRPLQLPTGITVDKDGKLYIVDTQANAVIDASAK